VEQVLHVADARDPAYLALDALDLLGIFELSAQHHDPAVGVDADPSLGIVRSRYSSLSTLRTRPTSSSSGASCSRCVIVCASPTTLPAS
jgi:hypothetical protein